MNSTALSAGLSPAQYILSEIPLTSAHRPSSARINVLRLRCIAVGILLSRWIDGDDRHRETPPLAGQFTTKHRRWLSFRADVLGDADADYALTLNDQTNWSANNVR